MLFSQQQADWIRSSKRHTREADHAVRIDIPLLVTLHRAAYAGTDSQERVERRRPAPFEVVMVLLHQLPESLRVSGCYACHALLIARGDRQHLILVGPRREVVAISPAHVRHIDTRHPE